MALLLDNKILAAAEQELERSLTPKNREDYMKVVVAGMKVAKAGGIGGMLGKLRGNPDPIGGCVRGAINLAVMLKMQARGVMPDAAMIPGAWTLMLQALDFADKAGVIKVGAPELEKASRIFANEIFRALKITPAMLEAAGKNVQGVMQDPAKMEIIARRIGAVKDPRASTPTLAPEQPMTGGVR